MALQRKALVILLDAARRQDAYQAFDNSPSRALSGSARGMLIAPSCWTIPSVASLLTGRFASEHGLGWPLRQMQCHVPGADDVLRAAGKQFLLLTGNHAYASPMLGCREDYVCLPLPPERRLAAEFRRVCCGMDDGGHAMLQRVRKMAATQSLPDLLVLHLQETHHPYLPPPQGLALGARLRYALGRIAYCTSPRAQVWEFAAHATAADWAEARQRYLQCLAYDVRIVEGILEAYAAAGVLQDSLVIITADHGEHLGEHGLADHQASLHEELVVTPCALLAPGVPEGAQIPGQFQHTDVLHTICRFLDVPQDGPAPAWAPLDLLDPSAWAMGHEHAFMEWTTWGEKKLAALQRRNPSYDFVRLNRDLVGVRTHDWKYIEGSDGVRELYDLQQDPQEQRNVLAERPDVAAQLQQKLWEWRQAVTGATCACGEGGEEPYSQAEQDEVERRLRDLGYM